jgi:hypothetical protein
VANLVPLFLNATSSTVQAGSSAIGSSSATGINVASGDGAKFAVGTNQYVPCVIVDTSTSPETVKEYVWVTARSTDALTVVRQAEDSGSYPASTTTIQAGYTIAAVASKATLWQPAGNVPAPYHHGMFGWSIDPITLSDATGLTSGRVFLTAIPLSVTASITKVWLLTAGSVGTARTSGQCFVGLYDSAGTRLGVSADTSTTTTATYTAYGINISGGPITVTGGPGVIVYAAVLMNYTGTFTLASPNNNTANTWTNPNLTATTGARCLVLSATGQTSLPSPATLTGASISSGMWMGLS